MIEIKILDDRHIQWANDLWRAMRLGEDRFGHIQVLATHLALAEKRGTEHEREACIQIADEMAELQLTKSMKAKLKQCAASMRERGGAP